jgi:hypothetical protein
MARHKIGAPTPEKIDDMWQRKATAASIIAVRELVAGGVIPPATPISRLSDSEWAWFTAANIFAWIKCRSEQATAEGWNTELALRLTGLSPQPWDAGAVESVLPDLAEMQGVDWSKPIMSWPKDMMVKFLIKALNLIHAAMVARDVGGGIAHRGKGLEEVQRIASAEAGGPLLAPGELDDSIPF